MRFLFHPSHEKEHRCNSLVVSRWQSLAHCSTRPASRPTLPFLLRVTRTASYLHIGPVGCEATDVATLLSSLLLEGSQADFVHRQTSLRHVSSCFGPLVLSHQLNALELSKIESSKQLKKTCLLQSCQCLRSRVVGSATGKGEKILCSLHLSLCEHAKPWSAML